MYALVVWVSTSWMGRVDIMMLTHHPKFSRLGSWLLGESMLLVIVMCILPFWSC